MDALHIPKIKPKGHISEKASLAPLRETLLHIFSQCEKGLWLVGGTALAGYYAEHRRSDDLDLFAVDPMVHREAALAVKSLKGKGAQLSNERTTPNFYHADIQFRDHKFTIDVVLDEYLHKIGQAIRTEDGVWIADIATLFATKAACLVSRCSEKDLFDLDWIISQWKEFHVSELIRYGSQIDGGLNVETLLFSIKNARLRKEACHFLLPKSSMTVEQAYKKIVGLQKRFIGDLLEYEKGLQMSPEVRALSQALRDQKNFHKKR